MLSSPSVGRRINSALLTAGLLQWRALHISITTNVSHDAWDRSPSVLEY